MGAAGLLGLTAEQPERGRPLLIQVLNYDGPALSEEVVPVCTGGAGPVIEQSRKLHPAHDSFTPH